jgi:sugar phosphate isomerase/epimerase
VPTRFSFQLYSARLQPPVNKTIAMLAELGYREVEGFGGVYDEPEKLRKVMDKNGVSMPTGHFGLDMLEKEKKKVLSIAATLGISRLICPWIAPELRAPTAKGWKDLGKRLSVLAESYRAEGHSLAWHNHDFEFVEFKDGTTPHEHLFENAPLLDWEIDVAWIVRAKSNPLKWIKRYASAITCVHIKDIAKRGENVDEDGWADIGHGTMDWAKIMGAIAETRCVHFVLEHDKPSDVERFAKRSMATVKKL